MDNITVRRFVNAVKPTPDGLFEAENFGFYVNPESGCIVMEEKYTSKLGEHAFTNQKAAALFLWYMNSDRDDKTICDFVPFFKYSMNNSSPLFNSNYGYYFFDEGGIANCIHALSANQDTRHACIMINRNSIMFGNDTDKLCTNSVTFRIRNMALNMTVHMRSNHFINMMPLDVFSFSMFYSLLFNQLKLHVYNGLKIGTYYHFADSMHINANQMQELTKLSFPMKTDKTAFNFSSINWNNELFDKLTHWVENKQS